MVGNLARQFVHQVQRQVMAPARNRLQLRARNAGRRVAAAGAGNQRIILAVKDQRRNADLADHGAAVAVGKDSRQMPRRPLGVMATPHAVQGPLAQAVLARRVFRRPDRAGEHDPVFDQRVLLLARRPRDEGPQRLLPGCGQLRVAGGRKNLREAEAAIRISGCDMLGDHGIFGKRLMYDASARVPLIVVAPKGDGRVAIGGRDDRLVMLNDLMPTMLDMAGIAAPDTVEGMSAVSETRRDHIYGESHLGAKATRMVRDARHKLIWYVAGNRFQLFDMQADPQEQVDLAGQAPLKPVEDRLRALLRASLYGEDLQFVNGDRFIGMPEPEVTVPDNRGLSGQRGFHYPQVPASDPTVAVGAV